MFSASVAQRRAWFLHRIGGRPTAGNLPVALRMTGELNAGALIEAVGDLVIRHEALRTVFPEDREGMPQPRVIPAGQAQGEVRVSDSAGQDAAGLLRRASEHIFDIASEPQIRADLLRGPGGPAGAHLLALTFHQITVDELSLQPLLHDLEVAYAARREGAVPRRPAPRSQWRRRIETEQRLLAATQHAGSYAQRRLAYWRAELAGLPDPMPLPTDRRRPPHASGHAATVPFTLDAGLVEALRELARAGSVPLGSVIRAAVAVLLHQTGSGTDIVMGVPAAGRAVPPEDAPIGRYRDVAVLRLDLRESPGFGELLAHVRRQEQAALVQPDIPFAHLVGELAPRRPAAHHPLFQVKCQGPEQSALTVDLPGLAATVERPAAAAMWHDLGFTLRPGPGGTLDGEISYACELFDRATVETMVSSLEHILRHVAENPQARVGRMEMRDPAQRQQLAGQSVGPAAPVPVPAVPELVRVQAAATPEAVAVTDGITALTYRELQERASALARRLRQAGAGPETVVGLALARGADLVVGMLGILKSGAAYLPLDHRYPSGRLSFMIEDARPRFILTDKETARALPETNTPWSCIDDLGPADRDGDPGDDRTGAELVPQHLAYVMYTSGSTGTPKGVAVTHGNVVNGVSRLAPLVGMHPGAVMLAGTSVNFDVSVFEIFAALGSGARVDVVRDVLVLAERGGWTGDVLHTVPSVLTDVLDQVSGKLRVRTVVCAGEQLSVDLVTRIRTALPAAQLINAYGQTESFYATTHTVPSEQGGTGAVPIGGPLGNMRGYVLGPGLLPLPPRIPGELYVGGSVARGYRGQPAMTAARFVPDPFGAPGERMYRTGDLARWNAAGELEILGRADGQMKIRGIRVEPGEIEAVLAGHPGIAQAAVAVRRTTGGTGGRIVAYLVPSSAPDGGAEDPLAPRRLRRYVADRLPAYMIPSAFVRLGQLPLAPNGKLDRARLPEPRRAEAGRREADVLLERPLTELFTELLGGARVEVDDDFFDLGGDAFLAVRLLRRIRSEFGSAPAMREFITAPTVASVADHLRSAAPAS